MKGERPQRTARRVNLRAPTRGQLNRSWYKITNATGADSRPAQIHLYDEIGYWGVSAGAFIDELKTVSAGNIELRVNSPGGEIFDGFAIYNALAGHPAPITAYVDGLAASAASFIIQAADKIIAQETSQVMIHNGIGFVFGDAKDLRETANQLDQLSDMIAKIYAARSGVDVEQWLAAMTAETWYTADEAMRAGLVDEVAPMRKRGEGGPENKAGSPIVPYADWDLSPYRYAGRTAAPAPTIPTNVTRRAVAPAEVTSTEQGAGRTECLFDWLTGPTVSSTVDATENDPLAALRG